MTTVADVSTETNGYSLVKLNNANYKVLLSNVRKVGDLDHSKSSCLIYRTFRGIQRKVVSECAV